MLDLGPELRTFHFYHKVACSGISHVTLSISILFVTDLFERQISARLNYVNDFKIIMKRV